MKLLITGGAGFIGSNIVSHMMQDPSVTLVRVVDNLISGSKDNISAYSDNSKFEFIEGDLRDLSTCLKSVKGCTHICHQAALGSVPRSVKDPITTNQHNISATLNLFEAARQEGIRKIVFASSSSVYGDDPTLPKVEEITGQPLSPYALTKKTKEAYAKLFAELYGISITALRYFNVFGPRQSPKGPYAAVIPLFVKAILDNQQATIFGDGEQSRDFTYIDNVILANKLALEAEETLEKYQVYNIALGDKTSINQLYEKIKTALGKDIDATYAPPRQGDILHSLADISRISEKLNYKPVVSIDEGIKRTVSWFKQYYEK